MKKLFLLFLAIGITASANAMSTDDIEVSYNFGSFEIDSSLTIAVCDTSYHITYELNPDSVRIINVNTEQGTFCYLKLPGQASYQLMDIPGLPELPFKSINLQIPMTSLGDSIGLTNLAVEYQYLDLPYRYIPVQEISHEEDTEEFEYNEYYYDTCSSFNSFGNFIESTPVLECMGASGMYINFQPIQYNASLNQVRIIKALSFDVNTPSLHSIPTKELAIGNGFYQPHGWRDVEIGEGHMPAYNIAIITRQSLISGISEYVLYRRSQGHTVNVYTTENFSVGASPTAQEIKDFINALTSTGSNPINYIEIVGNPLLIPYAAGDVDDPNNPATDIAYITDIASRMERGKPINCSYVIGRWPVSSIEDINNLGRKIREFEETIYDTPKNKLFSSVINGIDSRNNAVSNIYFSEMNDIADRLDKVGISNERIDGRQYSSLTQLMSDPNHLKNLWLIFYVGHGWYSCCGTPLKCGLVTTNYDIPPIQYSFACLTNGFKEDNNFGRKWTCTENGGVANFASTTESYFHTNSAYSKKIAEVFSTQNTLGINIARGMMDYYNSSRRHIRKRQVYRYCLFGSPVLYLPGYPAPLHITDPLFIPSKSEGNIIEYTAESNSILIKDNSNSSLISIYSISGALLYTGEISPNTQLDCSFLPDGVYLAKAFSAGGEMQSHIKFIVKH